MAQVTALSARQDICDEDRVRYTAFMDEMRKNTAKTAENTKKQDQMIAVFDEAMAAWKGLSVLSKAIKWLAGIITAVGGVYFAYKGYMHNG